MDTRHEVDQLVLELQKVKQEVSGRPEHMPRVGGCDGSGGGGWDSPVAVAQSLGKAASEASSNGLSLSSSQQHCPRAGGLGTVQSDTVTW